MTLADDTARIIAMSEAREEFITLEDGYRYFAPEGGIHGAFASWMLRALAGYLDECNAAWDAQIQSDPCIGGAPCEEPWQNGTKVHDPLVGLKSVLLLNDASSIPALQRCAAPRAFPI